MLISLASGLALPSVSADSVFSEISTPWYRTGNGVFDVALEDIDLDGYLDVITANDYEKKFYIWTNDQRGNFENMQTYDVANYQRSLEMGDVDGDNDLDIVNTNPSNGTVSILFNTDGLGTFGGETSYTVGRLPYNLYLGDIDNDNDLDIVTANFGSEEYNISVLKNNGSGFFGNLKNYWVGFRPLCIHMGDLDGDNYIDVVTAHQEIDKIAVLFNDGAGRFGGIINFSTWQFPSSVFIGDVDGDTHNDIAVAGGDYALNQDEDMISVFKNDGTGKFKGRVDYLGGNNPHSLHLSDIDSDGDLDAVTVNGDYNLGIFINDGDGAFKTKLEFPTGGNPLSLCLGDIDNDSDLDVVVATDFLPGDRVYVLKNEGNGWFNIVTNYPTTDDPISVAVGDIDGDDDLDMVSANYQSRTITVYFSDGDANFGGRTDYYVENWSYPNTVALGDMDNDEDLDLFYSGGGASPTGYASLRKNDGNGVFGSQIDYTMGSYPRLYIADINGNSYLDIVTVNMNDNDLSRRFNDGAGGFLGETTFGGTDGLSSPSAICMGNIDGDMDLDIVVADSGFNQNEAVIFRNNGAGTFTHLADYPVGNQPKGVAFGDVDKDGDIDIITANRNDDTISVLLNNGFGSYGTSTDYPVGDQPYFVAVGDVDGDSDNDVISANMYEGTLTLYKNNGYGGFGFRVDYPAGSGVDCVRLVDIDKDVDLDIVCVISGQDNISIRHNRNNYDFYLDSDGDGFPDYADEFPDDSLEWIDSDGDGWGDNSDELPWDSFEHVDSDGDRHGDQFDDAFPQDPTEWDDTDGDGWGDNSDAFPQDNTEWFDSDGDGVGNNADFLPYDETQQKDTDGDGYGDNPPPNTNGDLFPNDSTEWRDTDGDGYGDNLHDAFPYDETQWSDTDSDGYGDDINGNNPDMFPNNPLEWGDNDVDGIGDNTDDDDDNDGYSDSMERSYGTDPLNYAEHPADFDSDYIPDDTDEDDDNDGFSDTMEQNLGYNSKDPTDFPPDNDYDGIPDAVDEDDDNDGWSDGIDAFPTNPAAWEDTDSDGKPDEIDMDADNPTALVEDTDDDNDKFDDTKDDFPKNPNEWTDTDGDGTGDNSDADMDNDGWSNYVEESAGSDPRNKTDVPQDTDGDGIADNADLDDDNDGVLDYDDYAPLDASVQKDPNLIRIAGVEFEVGELVVGILMAAGAVFLGSVVFTRKKRLYNRYKQQINDSSSVSGLNEINTSIKSDGEKERLTYMQMTMLKEQYDDRYMALRESELEDKLGELPSKVQERIREVISDKIITEEEFEDMQKWLVRLRDSKTFNTEKKAKLQEVLQVWVDENID